MEDLSNFDMVSLFVGVFGVLISIVTWLHANYKSKIDKKAIEGYEDKLKITIEGYEDKLNSISMIAQKALRNFYFAPLSSDKDRIKVAEKTIENLSAIESITPKSKLFAEGGADVLSKLLSGEDLYTYTTLFDLENSDEISDVWVVTPDLEPDLSNEMVGELVGGNIKRGKIYNIFYPAGLPDENNKIESMKKNLTCYGKYSDYSDKINVYPIKKDEYHHVFSNSERNWVFYKESSGRVKQAFMEVRLSSHKTGILWEQIAPEKSIVFLAYLESFINPKTPNKEREKDEKLSSSVEVKSND